MWECTESDSIALFMELEQAVDHLGLDSAYLEFHHLEWLKIRNIPMSMCVEFMPWGESGKLTMTKGGKKMLNTSKMIKDVWISLYL